MASMKKKVKRQDTVELLEPPESFTQLRLTANLLALVAMLVLIADVVLATWAGVEHTVLFCLIAVCVLLLTLGCHLGTTCLSDEEGHKALGRAAACDSLICLINVVCLDSFLYEEETYNYFGHSGNVLVEERKFGILLELVCSFIIFHVVQKQYAKAKSWRPKSMEMGSGKSSSMV